MQHVSVLIKPVSSLCNLHCDYCFYNDIADSRAEACTERMSAETLEIIVRKVLSSAESGCTFMFQGGEPTLAGIDFFRNFVRLTEEHNKRGVQITRALQTNGYRLSDEFMKFLAEEKFLVGISLDGPEEIHDLHRKCRDGSKKPFARVLDTLHRMQRAKVEHSVLAVVTNASATRGKEIYEFMRDNDVRTFQFIPCLDPLRAEFSEEATALTSDNLCRFMCDVFDEWLKDLLKGRYMSIRHFDNYMSLLMSGRAQSCNMTGGCHMQNVIEGDGSVYPCDFYALDDYLIGNIRDLSIEELAAEPKVREFIERSHALPDACRTCGYVMLCRNGCMRERQLSDGRTVYCEAFREFFSRKLPGLTGALRVLTSGGMPRSV